MYITMVGAECAPVAKVGGLGEVILGLSRELARRGNEVEVILPKYDCLRLDLIDDLHLAYEGLQVPFYDQQLPFDVARGTVEGIPLFFVDPHSEHRFFERDLIYGEADDPGRFAFFSRAVLEFLLKAGKVPDIIHCHDWQAGLVPVLFWEVFQSLGLTRPRVCHTLHNLAYQGVAGDYVLRAVGLDPARLVTPDRLADWRDPQAVNLLKGAIVFSSFLTTVSPRYAWEILHTDQGMGLQEALYLHRHKLRGVLNGIDERTWCPKSDPYIVQPYDPDTLPGKAQNKRALRRRFGLEDAAKPLVSILGRLDRQQDVHLLRHAIYYSLENGCQMILLGNPSEPWIEELFRDVKRRTDGSADCHLELGYDEELAHLIHAGADMIVVPSLYEPCGLMPMIAMKYGVVPVVSRIGGLADTVFDANYSDKAFEEVNGFSFDDLTPEGLESALGRAIRLWFEYPEYFRQLRLNGMHADHSWIGPARHYMDIFESTRAFQAPCMDSTEG
jgi:starch synthase